MQGIAQRHRPARRQPEGRHDQRHQQANDETRHLHPQLIARFGKVFLAERGFQFPCNGFQFRFRGRHTCLLVK